MTASDKPITKKFWVLRSLLIAGILFFVIYLVLTASDPPFHFRNPRMETIGMMQALLTANVAYVSDNRSLPKDLNNHSFLKALSGESTSKTVYMVFKVNQTNSSGEIVDAWGTPFRISYQSDIEVDIISAGDDKVFGTADDITGR